MAVSKKDCNVSIKRLTSKIENEKLDMKRNLTLYAKKENLKYSDRVIRNKKKIEKYQGHLESWQNLLKGIDNDSKSV